MDSTRTFVTNTSAKSRRIAGLDYEGLCTNSTAPSSSVLSAASPVFENEETTTTEIGKCFIIFSKNMPPDILGISISEVKTSGFSGTIWPSRKA